MDDLHASAERWEWQTGGEHDARVTAAAVAVREHRGIIFVRSVRERLAVRADEPHIDVRAASRRDERQALHVTVNEHLPTVSHSVSIRDLRRPPGDDLDRRDVRVFATSEREREVNQPIGVLRLAVEIGSASGKQQHGRESSGEGRQQMNPGEFCPARCVEECTTT